VHGRNRIHTMQKYLSGSRMVCRVGFVVVLAAALTHAATDCLADPTQAGCADDSVVAYDATAVQDRGGGRFARACLVKVIC